MLTEARKIAIGRMVDDAKSQGANAIIGFRLTSAAVMPIPFSFLFFMYLIINLSCKLLPPHCKSFYTN